MGAPRAVFSSGTASWGDDAERKIGRLAKASASPIAGMEPEMPGGAYFGGRGSGMRAAAAEETSGGEGNDFVPGGTSLGGRSGIEATAVEYASGGERSDFRPDFAYSGR